MHRGRQQTTTTNLARFPIAVPTATKITCSCAVWTSWRSVGQRVISAAPPHLLLFAATRATDGSSFDPLGDS